MDATVTPPDLWNLTQQNAIVESESDERRLMIRFLQKIKGGELSQLARLNPAEYKDFEHLEDTIYELVEIRLRCLMRGV